MEELKCYHTKKAKTITELAAEGRRKVLTTFSQRNTRHTPYAQFHLLSIQHTKGGCNKRRKLIRQCIVEIYSTAVVKQRNDFIFDRGRPSFSSWKRLFMEEAKLQALRFSDAKRPAFSLCIDSLA